jgi:hypothetical protein
VIHPVSTSAPSSVRQRSRNGLAGIGVTAKQPISSTGELATPAVVWTSSVPARGGMIWPSSEPSPTSSSMDNPVDVKVSARIDAASDRTAAARSRSLSESLSESPSEPGEPGEPSGSPSES